MTTIEAIEKIEAEALKLGLNNDGEALLASEVLGFLGAFFGAEWASLEDRFEAKEITPKQYCDGFCSLIDAYSRRKFHQSYADKINFLAERQVKMGVA